MQGQFSIFLSETAANAPDFIASGIKSCPSNLSPFIATNRQPSLRFLVSVDISVISFSNGAVECNAPAISDNNSFSINL